MANGTSILGTAFALAVLFGGIGAGVATAQDQPIVRKELLTADVTGIDGREGAMYTAEFGPGQAVGRHTHHGDEFVYLLEGTLIVEPEGKDPITLKPGDTAHLAQGVVHAAHNGSDSEPAKVLVFQVKEKGKPLAEAAQ